MKRKPSEPGLAEKDKEANFFDIWRHDPRPGGSQARHVVVKGGGMNGL